MNDLDKRPEPQPPPIKGSAPGTIRRFRVLLVIVAAVVGFVLFVVKLWW